MNFQLCRPAVTDPHKVRPCNYRGLQPYPVRIPPEVFRSTPRIPLENQLLHIPPSEWSILTRIPYIFPVVTPNLTDYCGSTVHAYVFPFTGLVGTGRQRTHKRYGAPNPIRSLLTGLRCRSKIFQNLMNFQLCRPAVTDPHKVRPCNYKGLQPYPVRIPPEVFRSTPRILLENQLLHIPPSEWSILTRIPYIFPVVTPKFDRLLWLNCACLCLPIYRVGRYRQVAYAQEICSS